MASSTDDARDDMARLDWLSQPGRTVGVPQEEIIMSYHTPHKEVHFYVEGRHQVAFGKTLREAIDNAMRVHHQGSGQP
jgi:hypothetical protein